MPTLTMTKGLPASGKTTWAKMQLAANNFTKRVNKDDLRAMIDNGKWSKENEKFVLEVRDYIVKSALLDGYDVIVDDTNLAPKHETTLRNIAEDMSKSDLVVGEIKFEIKDFTDVPLETCLERDRKRPNYVGEKVIKQMYRQFLAPKEEKQDVAQYEHQDGLRIAILCDIDGTLAHMNGRSPYEWHRVGEDTVDLAIRGILQAEYAAGSSIILFSGRDAVCRQETIKWLKNNHIPFDELWMRRQDDNRKDSIVKAELFDEFVRGKYNVKYVLDDRNQVVDMWRAMGLKCLQVEPGDF